jgi:hypothetical protein
LRCEGSVKNFQAVEKQKGARKFYKVSFSLQDAEGEYPCYFWQNCQEDIHPLAEGQKVVVVVKDVKKAEMLVQIEKIVESATTISKPVVILMKG